MLKSDKKKENFNKLIENPKAVLDFDQLRALTVENKKLDLWKIVTEKEKARAFESFGIKYSEKYSRRLMTNQTFNLGDIIYVKKPYALEWFDLPIFLSAGFKIKPS